MIKITNQEVGIDDEEIPETPKTGEEGDMETPNDEDEKDALEEE